jgi:hypothetical protein
MLHGRQSRRNAFSRWWSSRRAPGLMTSKRLRTRIVSRFATIVPTVSSMTESAKALTLMWVRMRNMPRSRVNQCWQP